MSHHVNKLGDYVLGRFHHSLTRVKQLVFIRHGEKLVDSNGLEVKGEPNLSPEGEVRAQNLYKVFGNVDGALLTPNVIYAMWQGKHEDKSNRPFETVAKVAEKLGMNPQMGERTATDGEYNKVFNNCFRQKDREDLVADINHRAKNGEFDDKTILFCWEHKNIPYIVAELGLTKDKLYWGLNPELNPDEWTKADDPDDAFTPIWVFAPGEGTFKVYKQFDVVPADPKNANSMPVFQEPSKPYSHVEWFKPFSPNEE